MAKHVCKIPDPPADTTRWMGTYGDMVTLLMAFFVMLFAVSDTNAKKFEAFVSGLAGPFDNQALSLGLVDGDNADAQVTPISMIAPNPGNQQDDPVEVGQLDEASLLEAASAAAAERQLGEVEEGLLEALDSTAVPISADVRDDERGLVVAISTDEVLFGVGSADLSEEGRQLIGEIAPILASAPNTIVIEGHTDDQPLDAGGYSNWNLSTDRAVAVVELLGESFGIDFGRLTATGYGEHRPLVPNDSDANRALNRRVEILIVGLDVVADDGAPASTTAGTPAGSLTDPGTATPTLPVPEVLDYSETVPLPGTPIATILGQ